MVRHEDGMTFAKCRAIGEQLLHGRLDIASQQDLFRTRINFEDTGRIVANPGCIPPGMNDPENDSVPLPLLSTNTLSLCNFNFFQTLANKDFANINSRYHRTDATSMVQISVADNYTIYFVHADMLQEGNNDQLSCVVAIAK